jgi:hypothetical protein
MGPLPSLWLCLPPHSGEWIAPLLQEHAAAQGQVETPVRQVHHAVAVGAQRRTAGVRWRLVRPGSLLDMGRRWRSAARITPRLRSRRRACRDRISGLILPGSGLPSHGVLAVIATKRQNLDADVGAVRRQLALEYHADLLPAEIPGRVLE